MGGRGWGWAVGGGEGGSGITVIEFQILVPEYLRSYRFSAEGW